MITFIYMDLKSRLQNLSKKQKAYIGVFVVIVSLLVWAFISAGVITHNFNRSQLQTDQNRQEALIKGIILTETKDEKKYWEQTDTTTFYNILKRLEMRKKPQERKLDDLKYLDGELNKPIIYGRHDLTKYAISELNELIAKEIEKEQANQTAQTPSTFDKEPEKSQEVFKEFKELCDYLEKYHFLTTDGKINVAKRASELLKNKENHELLKTYHKTHYEVKKGGLEKLAKQYEQTKGISR